MSCIIYVDASGAITFQMCRVDTPDINEMRSLSISSNVIKMEAANVGRCDKANLPDAAFR